jgi:hypothetical protein
VGEVEEEEEERNTKWNKVGGRRCINSCGTYSFAHRSRSDSEVAGSAITCLREREVWRETHNAQQATSKHWRVRDVCRVTWNTWNGQRLPAELCGRIVVTKSRWNLDASDERHGVVCGMWHVACGMWHVACVYACM